MNYLNRRWLFRHSAIIIALTALAVALGIFLLDLLIADFAARPEMQRVYYYSREVTNIGDSLHYFTLALLGLIFSRLLYPRLSFLRTKVSAARNRMIYYWSLFLLKALILCGIVLHIFKFTVGRQRPHVAENFYNLNFAPFNLHHHWQSWPSGHSQVMFTVATVNITWECPEGHDCQ